MKKDKQLALSPLILMGLTILSVAAIAPALSAAPNLTDGGFLRVGVGYSPLAKTSLDLSDSSITEAGAALTITGGIVWGRIHSVEIRLQNVYLNGESNATQGALTFSYTRYLIQRGPAPFFSGGIGLQHGPFIGTAGVAPATSVGAAVFLGAGLRLTRGLSIGADYSFGSTNKFIDNTFKYDFSHQQLIFSVHYTLLGG